MCTTAAHYVQQYTHVGGKTSSLSLLLQKGSNSAVLVLASTLHPSREELVQLLGFAGLDVPLLLVLVVVSLDLPALEHLGHDVLGSLEEEDGDDNRHS